ncbi:uncharacterized protein LOC144623046 [Crassostrea virginica]
MATKSGASKSDHSLESDRNAAQEDHQKGLETKGDVEEEFPLYPSESLTFAFMGVVVMMVSMSFNLSDEKPCALKTALDSIYLNYTITPCKYNTIKEIADGMTAWGLFLFLWNACLVFLPSLINCYKFCCIIRENTKLSLRLTFYFMFFLVSTIFSGGVTNQYALLKNEISTHGDVDYSDLQSSMLSDLENHYASDNINITDKYSKAWNTFFIKYDCCAVREIQGSTNDFDNTPWCTKSGSCKSKSSKIPKTCCKDVTQDDYQNAPPTCYASVNPGTYKHSCISRMRALSISNIDEGTVNTLLSYALAIGIYEIFIVGWAVKQEFKEFKRIMKFCLSSLPDD